MSYKVILLIIIPQQFIYNECNIIAIIPISVNKSQVDNFWKYTETVIKCALQTSVYAKYT